jgi:O-methyltransferase involved in polyketide biosynthesis
MQGSTAPGPQQPLAHYADIAHVARVYDYLLGGKDYFAVDAKAAEEALQINPDLVSTVRANRAFLARTTSYLAGQAGIRQFLDVGAGLPGSGNTHEVAQSIGPQSRIVYVDHDPIVLSHARALLTSAPEGRVGYVEADLREPGAILAAAAGTLDFGRPVAVLLLAVLHLIPDEEDPYELVRQLVAAVTPGSYVVISHAASDTGSGEMTVMADRLNELMAQQTVPRSHQQVARFFTGLDLLEPGLIRIQQWRPAPDADLTTPAQMWGGIGHRP